MYKARFSPHGDVVVSASFDGKIKFWNLDGNQLGFLEGHSGTVADVEFNSDGTILASGGYDNTVILLLHYDFEMP